MKKITTTALLEQLKTDTRQIILEVNYLLQLDHDILLQQPAADKWSVTQIIEHLNSYGRYYLPLIKASIITNKYPPSDVFTPGWLGDYFTRSMLPNEQGMVSNRMQAPRNHRPPADLNSIEVLEEFLRQEYLLLCLLNKAGKVNLQKIKIPISISRLIKIRLGDTFRFMIAHHQRHFVQIRNTINAVKGYNTRESVVLQCH